VAVLAPLGRLPDHVTPTHSGPDRSGRSGQPASTLGTDTSRHAVLGRRAPYARLKNRSAWTGLNLIIT
jgi:hypothetical protein